MATVVTTDWSELILKYLMAQGIGGGGRGGGCMYTPCGIPPYCQLGIPCDQGCAWPQCCGQNPEPPMDNGVNRSCSESSMYNNTYFVEPSTPQMIGACTLTVKPLHSDICQIRLDFINLELAEPDIDGRCLTDFFTVTGGLSTLPTICGSISGQHMYVNVDPSVGALKLTVDRSAESTTSPNWDIKVTQISCNSRYRAPSGCLQYYTETSGTVSSFNFKQSEPTLDDGTHEIANMDYGVCIKAAEGYCGIIWQRNTIGGNYGFTVSTEINAITPALIGDPSAGSTGVDCTTDYVLIPGGIDDTGVQNDRFCGSGFPTIVTSTSKPFVIYYHTDADEALDSDNRGFSLNYRQITTCY